MTKTEFPGYGTEQLPPLGILSTDTHFPRPAGDIINPYSFRYPYIVEVVPNATGPNVVTPDKFSDETIQTYKDAAQRLIDQGVIGIVTTCGFMSQIQDRLDLPLPLASSSLLQVPLLLNTLGKNSHIGILTFDGTVLGKTHFDGAGISPEMQKRILVQGEEPGGPLHTMIDGTTPYSHEDIENGLVSMAKKVVARDPKIVAILFECTQMPPFGRAVQRATGLPVYDVLTLCDWFYSGLVCRKIPDQD